MNEHNDSEIILRLSRELAKAEKDLAESNYEIRRAELQLSAAGIPSSFEDGNSSDDLSFNERVDCLCKAHGREQARTAKLNTALENVEIELDQLYSYVEDGGEKKGILSRIEDSKATAREARR